ncbi:MAG: hypothetical protein OEX12_11835 [Gammaproteobacteria bacterium]|nr:hypothetical protein [Gammaproteobacteria bacterium]
MADHILVGTTSQYGFALSNPVAVFTVDPAGSPVFRKLDEVVPSADGSFQLGWGTSYATEDWAGRVVVVEVDSNSTQKLQMKTLDWRAGMSPPGLDPVNHHADWAISGNDLIATRTGATGSNKYYRSEVPIEGRVYFEVELVLGADSYLYIAPLGSLASGDAPSLKPYAGVYLASSLISSPETGESWSLGSLAGVAPAVVSDRYMIAVDTLAGKIWIGRNGVWNDSGAGDPTTGASPLFEYSKPLRDMTLFGIGYNSNNTLQFMGSVADYLYAPPTGFNPWLKDTLL